MMEDSLLDEHAHTTRSRKSSTVSENFNILDFHRPVTVTQPGHYILSSPDSQCSITLYNDVLSDEPCEQLISEIEFLGTVVQLSVPYKDSIKQLPRFFAWYGPFDYAYSGVVMKAHEINDCPHIISAYQIIADQLLKSDNIAQSADCFLINQYRNGQDSCGEHCDDEPEVDLTSPIVTLSLGQDRHMLIRELSNPGNAITIKLEPDSVLVMAGNDFQKQYTHQIPKDKSCTLSRTSITYRTCNKEFLKQKSAISTPLVDIALPAVPTQRLQSEQPKISSPVAPNLHSDSQPSSTTAPPILPNTSPIDSGKFFSQEVGCKLLPLSLDALCEATDLLKEKSLKSELSQHGCPITGSVAECRKRLKNKVKDCFKHLSTHLSQSQTACEPTEPVCVTNAIEMLEKSIIDLQAKISAQHSVLQTLALCSDQGDKKSQPAPKNVQKELCSVDKRLEKIEELVGSIKEEQEESAKFISECKSDTQLIKKDATELKERLVTLQKESSASSSNSTTTSHKKNQKKSPKAQTNNSRTQTKNQPRKVRKVLLLHDSQLNEFKPESFSKGFKVETQKVGTYNDLANKHMRDVISKPQVDCYTLQLGVNDYRNNNTSTEKATSDAKTCINKLLTNSSAKVVVVLPTPTPGSLSSKTTDFIKEVTDFITEKRLANNYHHRLFTVNNTGNFSRALSAAESSDDSPKPLKSDNLHVSEYGLKKLCMNIKFGLYRAFGMKPPRKQAPAEP